jgi:hypothetical protein
MWLSVTSHAMAIVMGLPIKGTISNCTREADKLAFLSSTIGDKAVTISTVLAAVGIFAMCIAGNIGTTCVYDLKPWHGFGLFGVQMVLAVGVWLPANMELFKHHISHYWMKKAKNVPNVRYGRQRAHLQYKIKKSTTCHSFFSHIEHIQITYKYYLYIISLVSFLPLCRNLNNNI